MKPPSPATLAAYVLQPMASTIKTRMLRDAEFRRRAGFTGGSSSPITQSLVVSTDSLINALRTAMTGRKKTKIKTAEKKTVTAKLKSQPDGSVSLYVGDEGINVKDADIASGNRKVREQALGRIFNGRPLTKEAEGRWLTIAAGRRFTNEEIVDLFTDVAATPEAVNSALSEPQRLSIDDLVPKDSGYYCRLVGSWSGATTLKEYIENEMGSEREWLLRNHRPAAIGRIAYSALSPALVPVDGLGAMTADELKPLLARNDPFSLVFVFEVACARLKDDPAFLDLGSRALERLFGDKQKAMTRCTVFCAAVVTAITRARLIFQEESAPLFWFRLAVFSHAGVVTDAMGHMADADDFLKWANEQVGPQYVWYSIVDRWESPRWEPDWVGEDQIYAETAGRCWGALQAISETVRPARWAELLESQIKALAEEKHSISPFFAGPLDDFVEHRPHQRAQSLLDVEDRLRTANTIEETRGLAGLVYLDVPSATVAEDVLRILDGIRASAHEDPELEKGFLYVCARLAAVVRSEPLANAVKRVAIAIIDSFNKKTGQCDPGFGRIAHLLGISRRTVIRSIPRLENAKVLSRSRYKGNSHRNSYQPNWAYFRQMEENWRARKKTKHWTWAPQDEVSLSEPASCHSGDANPVTQTNTTNQSNETRPSSSPSSSNQVGRFQNQRRSNVQSVRGAGSAPSHRDVSFAAAERRWTTELNRRFARMPETHARILEAIDPDLQRAATEAETKRRGAGLDVVFARLSSIKNVSEHTG